MRDSSICERSWSFHLAMVIHSHLHRYIYLELWWRGFKSKTEALRAGWLSHWGDLSSGLSFICIIHNSQSWGHVRYSQRKVEGMSDIHKEKLRACQIFTKKSWGHVTYMSSLKDALVHGSRNVISTNNNKECHKMRNRPWSEKTTTTIYS